MDNNRSDEQNLGEFEKLPASSLQFHSDLKNAVVINSKMTLTQKKRLLLTLRNMVDSISDRKTIIENNFRIIKRFEKELDFRSQRDIKDVNRMVKMVENIPLCDISIEDQIQKNAFRYKVINIEGDIDIPDYSNLDVEKEPSEAAKRKRKRTIEPKEVNPFSKRMFTRESVAREGLPVVEPYESRSLPPMKMVTTHLDPAVFWQEVERYYKRFDEEHIRMMLGDPSPELQIQDNRTEMETKPFDCLLSCLIPEPTCRISEGVSSKTQEVPSELNTDPLFIKQELKKEDFVDDSLLQNDKKDDELEQLKKELKTVILKNGAFFRKHKEAFLKALKRDIQIKKDEDAIKQLELDVNYLKL